MHLFANKLSSKLPIAFVVPKCFGFPVPAAKMILILSEGLRTYFELCMAGMEVGSPENGFDEISDLLKDDESILPEDLDLSFIISKDIAGDYVYDDSAGIDKFNSHLRERELASFSSNLGGYEIPGTCTQNFHSSAQNRCHNDGLMDANVFYDQKLHSQPRRDEYYQDAHKLCGNYLGDSTFQMDAESVDDEVLVNVCPMPHGFPVEDHGLEGEIIDKSKTPLHNETGDRNLSEKLEQEMNLVEFRYNEEEEEEHKVSVDQIHKLDAPSLNQGDSESTSENANVSRNSSDASKEVESALVEQHDQERNSQVSASPMTSREISASPETSLCAGRITYDHRLSAPNSHNDTLYPNTPPDQIHSQAEFYEGNGDTPSMNHLVHDGGQKSASSWDLGQRFQQVEGSSGRSIRIPRNHHRKRSRPQSPRQINPSSRCKRDCSTNFQERSPYSSEGRKRPSVKAACFHLSPRSQNTSATEGNRELFYNSSRSCKRKYDLAGSSDQGREVTCKDHLLESSCQKLSFQHESQERSLNRFSSKHAPASPRNHHSRHYQRKMDGDVSLSPAGRWDSCSGYKREHNKSRSRSPYGGNR